MREFYVVTTLLGFLGGLFCLYEPEVHGLHIERRLVSRAEAWSISVDDPERLGSLANREYIKKALLGFLRGHQGHQDESLLVGQGFCLAMVAFSTLGLLTGRNRVKHVPVACTP